MGNRAVITTRANFENNGIGIYLHWNGGYDSVSAFLKYCELRKFRSPDQDCYGWAYLCGVITNFFGDGLSVGIDTIDHLDTDNGDNGLYIIEGWKIVDRMYHTGREQNSYSMQDMLESIDRAQPVEVQLGDVLKAKSTTTADICIGDNVYFFDAIHGKYELTEVVGFGDEVYVNGVIKRGIPYVNKYGTDYKANPNNYINDNSCLKAE